MELILIGYWKETSEDPWPDVKQFVDAQWDAETRADVALYLRRGIVARAYFGPSLCRFCGKPNGSVELTDYVYLWPEGLRHYLSEHDVRLPETFVQHVYRTREKMDEVRVNDQWWLGQTPGSV